MKKALFLMLVLTLVLTACSKDNKTDDIDNQKALIIESYEIANDLPANLKGVLGKDINIYKLTNNTDKDIKIEVNIISKNKAGKNYSSSQYEVVHKTQKGSKDNFLAFEVKTETVRIFYNNTEHALYGHKDSTGTDYFGDKSLQSFFTGKSVINKRFPIFVSTNNSSLSMEDFIDVNNPLKVKYDDFILIEIKVLEN